MPQTTYLLNINRSDYFLIANMTVMIFGIIYCIIKIVLVADIKRTITTCFTNKVEINPAYVAEQGCMGLNVFLMRQ